MNCLSMRHALVDWLGIKLENDLSEGGELALRYVENGKSE